jgi:MFS family permease
MVFLVGTFGFNFPIFISTMSTVEFGKGSAEFGLLSSVMAVGAVAGSLLAARRERVRFIVVVVASGAFGLVCIVAALSPSYLFFAIVLVAIGVCSLTMMNTANAYVQTTTEPQMRGRVMALYMAIFAGGTPIGAPIVGLVANVWGPRWSLAIGAASGIAAALIAVVWLSRKRNQSTATASIPLAVETREIATQEIAIEGATAVRTS